MLPLARSPVLRATDRDEAIASIRLRHPGVRAFRSGSQRNGAWRMDVNYARLGDIGLSCAQSSACEYVTAPDGIVRAFVPLQQSVSLTTGAWSRTVRPHECAMALLDAEVGCNFADRFMGIFVLCPETSLMEALQAIDAGCDLAKALDRLARAAEADWRLFQHQLRATLALLDDGPNLLLDVPAFQQAHRDLIRFHMASVIACASRNPARGDGHSRYTRRAMAYVEAHYAEPIGIETLARHADCSVRTLQVSMAADLGCSITGHIRSVRLGHARKMLLNAAAGSTVSGVALDCGFNHLSDFAKSYAAVFRERPSDTLAEGRANARWH